MNIETTLKVISENEYTILVVNPHGDIQNLLPLTSMPTPELLMQIGENNKGSACKILQKANFTERQLHNEIKGLVEALEWAKTHKLKPGANFPDKIDK